MLNFPNFRQLDAMDCGPACLKIISVFHGKSFSMKKLRDLCNVNREGVSLLGIGKACDKLNLKSLSLKINTEDLKNKIPLPCIIHWNLSHFVVLYKIKRKTFYISDPQLGLVKYGESEFKKKWLNDQNKGFVLLIEPTPEFHLLENSKSKSGLSRFYKYILPHKNLLIQVFFCLILGIFVNLLFPLITQAIVDVGIGTKDFQFIQILLLASIVLTVSSSVSGFIQNRMMLFVADRVNVSMVLQFVNKIIGLPISFFERKMTSDILGRISDHSRIQNFVFDSLLSITIAFLSFLVYAGILISYSTGLFLIFILGTGFFILWTVLFLSARRRLDVEMFDVSVTNQNDVLQIIDNINEIKANGIQKLKEWEWERNRLNVFRLNVKMLNLSQIQSIGSILINKIKNILLLFVSAKAVINGDMSLGMMLSVQYILGQMEGPVGKFLHFVQSIQDAKISLERVNEVMLEEEDEDISATIPNIPIPNEFFIKIEDLSFSYHSDSQKVLKNVSLLIPKGKTTAIVGSSGSGKTTLVKILLKFYNNYTGSIFLNDNIDFNSIDMEAWRMRCGSILQDGKLFNDTILNNIIMDENNLNSTRLFEAIELSNLSEFVNSLPLRLNTRIGYNGQGISGGQKQRILIARAIYRNPDVILMDEATNSLDAKNENAINDKILNFFSNRTKIIIAHRLSTIINADHIIVLDNGIVAESGSHEELIKNNDGIYKELFGYQSLILEDV